MRLALLFVASTMPSTGAADTEAPERTAVERGEGAGFSYQIFSTQREGEPFQRYEARGRIQASPEVLFRAARSVTSDPARAAAGQTRRILPGSDDDQFFVYTRIDLPFPFSDRDIVMRGVRRREGDGLRLDAEASKHPDAPADENAIRIEHWAGFWSFDPAEEGATDVVYATYSDAGGSLPGWLVDPLNEGNVVRVFEQVVEEAVRPTEKPTP